MSGKTQPEGKFAGATAEGTVEIHHANQLRSAEFKKLMRKPSIWACLIGFAILGGVIAEAWLGLGVLGGIVVFAVIVLIIFGVADQRAEDAFYDYYCQTHGLTRIPDPEIGELTPLLRKGDKSNTDEIFSGRLAKGVEGELVLWTYTEVHQDSDGSDTETNYPFTFVHVEMPEIIQHMSDLRVQRAGFKVFDKVQDKFLGDFKRVTLESDAFAKRFEVFVKKDQDEVWTRRLFSPSFIVWLTENPPDSFAFELEDGHLIAYVEKHMDDSAKLEEITDAGSTVAARLLEEVAQTSPRAQREIGH